MLGSQNNNVDQLSIQFVTTAQVIPAKIVSVDCRCAVRLSIKRLTFTSCEKIKPPFLRQNLVFFKTFFPKSEIILRPQL